MPTISGPLSVVTEAAAVVTAVWVQARELRPHGEGAILPQRARVTLDAGSTINFPCAPGPAMLIWQVGSVEGHAPILVSEEPDQTLASVVKAAKLASGRTADELAALVAQVVRDASSASAAAGSASSSAGAAASARDTAVSARDAAVDDRDEAVTAAGVATGARDATLTARDAAVTARNEAEGYSAAASMWATHAADDAASAQLAESGAGTARDQAQTLVSEANQALDQALAVIRDAESLQDVVAALEMVDTKISAAIADLVGTAPEHLDTLGELAAAVEGLDPALRALIADKVDKSEVSTDATASRVVRRTTAGDVLVPGDPSHATSAVGRDWVQAQLTSGLSRKSDVGHSHTPEQVGAAAAEDVAALQAARTTVMVNPPGGTTTLIAPTNPVTGQMHIFEVLPTATTTITVSALGPLADGVPASLTVEAGGVGLIGLRWSSSKSSWHVLTASVVK